MACCVLYMARRISFMFDKWIKKGASKATDSALEGFSKSLGEKIGPHIDMIQIGLVFGVIALGTHIVKRRSATPLPQAYIPPNLPSGQPVIVNNYYREREEMKHYEQRNQRDCYLSSNGQVHYQKAGKTYSKR